MKTLHKRCAGLDVHKAEVVACLRLISERKVEREVRRFPTTTQGLLALAEWLESARCTHVAMEATGVYWKPVWHILEGHFVLILANAAHVKNVPGRKSDVNDATWLADLLARGLIRSSFVPPPAIQELRDLTRTRRLTLLGGAAAWPKPEEERAENCCCSSLPNGSGPCPAG
jgi:transposase